MGDRVEEVREALSDGECTYRGLTLGGDWTVTVTHPSYAQKVLTVHIATGDCGAQPVAQTVILSPMP
jgi:hypothetical protein